MRKFLPKSLKSLLLSALVLSALVAGMCSCKAVRTITTTSSYSQVVNDSAKVTTTITSKTVEDYQGTKKR